MAQLIPECDYHATLGAVHDAGTGPFGHRMIVDITGGELVGERLKGSFAGTAGDWLLLGADGFSRLDVRSTLQTVDGAAVYVQFFGLLEMTPAVTAILGGGSTPTEFGDQYFFTTPRMETGDARYSWVNQTLFVGEGRFTPGQVEYHVYRVANS